MSGPTWERLKEIFDGAKDLPDPERATFLDEACAGDPALRSEVEELLAAHENAAGFFGATESVTREETASRREGPGTTIGRYKLLQLIGEGGFGSVYMAEQERPVRRKVALKIIKLGMDTKQVIARFEAERQALALMDHPNIARVLDAGSTEAGLPYFVMELVRGVPITEYCDANSLSTRSRLDLFQAVCSAVQHAHQKGIIHRDIKPSNVMVTLHDGTPVPKVIDFGIAKAMNQRLTDKTLFTEFRQFIGTPQYMSPEQAEMSGLDVDTRADIYSLGVLLYELLTGTTPFDPERLRSLAFSEIHRLIREEDPHKPSTRVSTLGEAATTTAKHRRTDARALRRTLAGDLDWIVMKALEKDRTRRYDTANALQQDIRRHLANEPVLAGPPGAAYRIGKFLRRNRTGVAVVGAVGAALLLGLGAATYGFWQAERERQLARQAAESAEAVNAFFDDMLASINPEQLHLHSAFGGANLAADATAHFSHDVSVADMLRWSAKRVESSFVGQPELEASMRETIGTTLLGLNEFDDALVQLAKARDLCREMFGEEHRETMRSRIHVAKALYESGNWVEADREARGVVADLERLEGTEDPLSMFAASLWATICTDQGEFSLADSIFGVTLERQRRVLGSDHRDTILTLIQWAGAYCWRGNGAKAEELAGEAWERARGAYSPDDAVVLWSESRLGLALAFLGQNERARDVLLPSIEKHRRVYGEDHTATRMATFALARASEESHDLDESIAYYRTAAGMRTANEFVIPRDLGYSLAIDRGRTDEALDILRSQYEIWSDPANELSQRVRPERFDLIRTGCRERYRRILLFTGRLDEARRIGLEELEELRDVAESEDATWNDWNRLAWSLLIAEPARLRNPPEALVWAERAVGALEGESDLNAGLVWDTVAKAREVLGDLSGAREAELSSVTAFGRGERNADEDAALSLANVARYDLALGRPEAAVAAIRDRLFAIDEEYADEPVARATAIRHVAEQLSWIGFVDLAEEASRRSVEVARSDGEKRDLLDALIARSRQMVRSSRIDEARSVLDEAEALYRECYVGEPIEWRPGLGVDPGSDGERSVRGRNTKNQLARALLAAGRLDSATELHRQVLATAGTAWNTMTPRLLLATEGPGAAEDDWRRLVTQGWLYNLAEQNPCRLARDESDYAQVLMDLGKWDEAARWLGHAMRRLEEWAGPASVDYRTAQRRLAARAAVRSGRGGGGVVTGGGANGDGR